ncbi:MAG: glycoside hydrolase family 5 protein, partial [Opitutaceae bacterium]
MFPLPFPIRALAPALLFCSCLGGVLPAKAEPLALHASGTFLCDSAGRPVVLKGVNICSLEWTNSGEHILASVKEAVGPWRATLIRLPISQDRWEGKMPDDKTGPDRSDGGAAYRRIVDRAVATASAAGAYVIVDLHWSDMGVWGRHEGQHPMPDDNTAVAWRDIAAHFANNPAVLMDAYNEPYGVSWAVWRNGGSVTDGGTTYHSPGMQGLVDVIRGAGARNPIVIGGLDWAYDLSGVGKGYAIADPNIVYSSHIYPSKPADWDAA